MGAFLPILVLFLSSAAHAARVNDSSLVMLFTFEEGQENPAQTYAADSMPQRLLGDIAFERGTVGWRLDSVGLNFLPGGTDEGAVSTLPVEGLAAELDGNFTVEMWMSINSAAADRAVIFGTENYPALPDVNNFTLCETEDAARFNGIQVVTDEVARTGIDMRAGAADCLQSFTSALPLDARPHHVVYTMDTSSNFPLFTQITYLDGGNPKFFVTSSYSTTSWDPTRRIHFGPLTRNEAGDFTSFEGTVYLFAVYNRSLTAAEVTQNFEAGLPNSRPTVTLVTFALEEDEPTVFYPEGADFDGDNVTIQVTAFPRAGNLSAVLANGTEVPITNETVPVFLDRDANSSLRYSPAPNANGIVAAITYRAFDGDKFSTEQLMVFNVTEINDPPVPVSFTAEAFADESLVLRLNGTDVDDGSSLTGARVTAFPNGTLFQFNASAAADGFRGAEITPGAPLVEDAELRLVYGALGLDPGASGGTVVEVDVFSFRVTDDGGLESEADGVATLEVLNNLAALPTEAVCDEDEVAVFAHRYRSQFSNETVELVLTSLPANGTLSTNETESRAVTDADLPYTVPGAALGMRYAPAENLFGSPLDTWEFYVRRLSDGWQSSPSVAAATVAAVNDPPVLSVAGGDGGGGGGGGAVLLRLVANSGATAAFAMSVADPDVDDTPYRVSLEPSTEVFISLAPDALLDEGITFVENDGYTDTSIVFEALRSGVNLALSEVTLEAADPSVGEVRVTVTDLGPDGVSVSRSVSFSASAAESSTQTSNSAVPPGYALYVVIMLLALPTLCCLCYGCVRARRYTHYRRVAKADTPEERRRAEEQSGATSCLDYWLPLQGQRRENVSAEDLEMHTAAAPVGEGPGYMAAASPSGGDTDDGSTR